MSKLLKDIIISTIIQEVINPKLDLEKIVKDKFNQIKEEFLSPSNKEENKTEDLFNYYFKLKEQTFINNVNRQKYILIDIIINEEDNMYFTVYVNKQTKTRLCRSLVDFHSNFKIVK